MSSDLLFVQNVWWLSMARCTDPEMGTDARVVLEITLGVQEQKFEKVVMYLFYV